MMKNTLTTLFLICFALFLQAQQNITIQDYLQNSKLKAQQEYGLTYVIEKKGTGNTVKKGDYVKINYSSQLLNNKVFDSTPSNEPFVFQVGYGQVIRGLDLGMTLLQEGSKAKLFVPSNLAYGSKGVGNTIPPNAPILFDIEVLDVMDFKAYNNYMVELEKRERQAFEQRKKEQKATDLKKIHEYALQNKLKVKRLPSGLSYAITKKGKGENAHSGAKMSVHYEGFLLDGSTFDSTKGKKPYVFKLGVNKVISGWEEGLQHFNKGAQGWLLIPSYMAYGPMGIQEEGIDIPENSVLIFNIKVEKIEQTSNAQVRR